MEGMTLSGKGLVHVGPSEQAVIRGGIGTELIRRIIGILVGAIGTVNEYLDDLIKGFKRGWESIKMEAV